MATTTPNLGLTLPIGSEKVSRQILNGNFSLIDTAYGTLNSKVTNLFKIATFTNSYNISPGVTSLKKIGDFTGNIPSDYTPIAITKFDTGKDGVTIRYFDAQAVTSPNNYFIGITNTNGTTATDTITVKILFVKDVVL